VKTRLGVLFSILLTASCLLAGATVCRRLVAWQLFLWNPSLAGTAEAISWDPKAPDFYFQLGLIRRDSPDYQDAEESIRDLQRAVALNPYRWDYLNELARSYELSGREAEALHLYRESIRLNPRSGLYRWRLGNYYLRNGRLGDALPCLKEAMALDPSYMTAAAHLLSQAGATAEDLVGICPGDTQSRLALLKTLEAGSNHPRQPIDRLWSEILAGTPAPTLSQGLFHLDYLERLGNLKRVRDNWIKLCRNSRLHDPAFEEGTNLVWNGEFELPILGRSWDWHLEQDFSYSVNLASREGIAGSTAFRVDFGGKANPEIEVLRQMVILRADEDCELVAHIRSAALTSDQGIYLQVIDSQTSEPVCESARILGTSDWQELVLRIPRSRKEPESYRVLSLLVRRDRSWKIDNRLAGTLWLDGVAIRAISAASDHTIVQN